MGDAIIFEGNHISTSITSRLPITTDEDGCPTAKQPFPPITKII
jgi:hypothetical protein